MPLLAKNGTLLFDVCEDVFQRVREGAQIFFRDVEGREKAQDDFVGQVADKAAADEFFPNGLRGEGQLDADHEAEAAHLFHVGQGSQALGEVLASSFDALDFALAAQLVEHAVRCGDG